MLIWVIAAPVMVAVAAFVIRGLGIRVVGARDRTRKTSFRVLAPHTVRLRKTPLTAAVGTFYLLVGEPNADFIEVGELFRSGSWWVTRRILTASSPDVLRARSGIVRGHGPLGSHPLDQAIDKIELTALEGHSVPAWFAPGDPAHWAIHVQGIRTSRAVTLRSMRESMQCGTTTLSIAFKGAGEGATRSDRCTLGLREWTDLRDAAIHARRQGANRISIVGWSMGAGIALELAHQEPHLVDDLVLVAPALDWTTIIRQGARRAGLPRPVGTFICRVLSTRVGAWLLQLPEPVDARTLDWGKRTLDIPTTIIHSRGDEEIPFQLSEAYAAANPSVCLHQFIDAPHAWEANAEPSRFSVVIKGALR